jgi:hypothetical protein
MGRLLFAGIVSIILAVLLFFPIYLSLNLYFDMNRKKLCFSINIYKWFKLLGGYIVPYPKGIALHVSNKKAILLQYNEFEKERKKFSFFQTIRLRKTSIVAETGAEYLLGVYLISLCWRILEVIKQGDAKDLHSTVWLAKGDVLRVSVNMSWLFNGYTILKEIISVLKEKNNNLWMKKVKKSIV